MGSPYMRLDRVVAGRDVWHFCGCDLLVPPTARSQLRCGRRVLSGCGRGEIGTVGIGIKTSPALGDVTVVGSSGRGGAVTGVSGVSTSTGVGVAATFAGAGRGNGIAVEIFGRARGSGTGSS